MERMCGSLQGRKWYCGSDSTIPKSVHTLSSPLRPQSCEPRSHTEGYIAAHVTGSDRAYLNLDLTNAVSLGTSSLKTLMLREGRYGERSRNPNADQPAADAAHDQGIHRPSRCLMHIINGRCRTQPRSTHCNCRSYTAETPPSLR